jgi:hypothetical protein
VGKIDAGVMRREGYPSNREEGKIDAGVMRREGEL